MPAEHAAVPAEAMPSPLLSLEIAAERLRALQAPASDAGVVRERVQRAPAETPGLLPVTQKPGDLRIARPSRMGTRPLGMGKATGQAVRPATGAAPQVQRTVEAAGARGEALAGEPGLQVAASPAQPSHVAGAAAAGPPLAQTEAPRQAVASTISTPTMSTKSAERPAAMPLAVKPQQASRQTVQRKESDRPAADASKRAALPDEEPAEPAARPQIGAHRQGAPTTAGAMLSTQSLPTGPSGVEDEVRPKPDLDALARKIMPLVQRMLMVERDRYPRY